MNIKTSFFLALALKYALLLNSLLACLFWLGVPTLLATNRHVVAPGTIANGLDVYPYNTWTNAATNIQWAVNVATNGETVWVSNGPVGGYWLTNQIEITNAIILQGTNGRDATIINGGFVAGAAGATTNNRCLVISNAGALVSGFTFSNGAVYNLNGGGVLIYNGGTLSNCAMKNCTVFGSNGVSSGGGVYIDNGSVKTSLISGNILRTTSGGNGGGIGGKDNSTILISGCVISNNNIIADAYAQSYGGGVYIHNGTIESSTICNNGYAAKSRGGGVYLNISTMRDCTITANSAQYSGGCSMAIAGTIKNCVFSGNSGAQNGSAMWLAATSAGAEYIMTVSDTIFMGHVGGDITVDMSGSLLARAIVSNCLVVGNTSAKIINTLGSNCFILNSTICSNGGLGVAASGGPRIRNCLIACNSNTAATYPGVGVRISSSSKLQSISGCTIAGNISTNMAVGSGAGIRFENTSNSFTAGWVSSCVIYSNGIGGTDDVFDASSPTNYDVLQYSCVGTNTGPFTGAGIIVTDPNFKDFAGGNYRLAANSPCINAGSNETWMTGAVDREGRRRIRYGTVDMGAYERINDGSIYGFR